MLEEMRMGCTDTGPPEEATEEQLSRVRETYFYLVKHFGAENAIAWWKTLPTSIKLEYNYAMWTYRPTGEFNWTE